MPSALKWKITFLSLTGVAMGAAAMKLAEQPPRNHLRVERGVASFASTAPGGEAPTLRKQLSLLQVSLRTADEIPEIGSDAITLVGTIQMNSDANADVLYKWDLPDGVRAVEGSIEASVSGLKAGQAADVRLTVVGFSKEELKLVSLLAFVPSGDTQLGSSAVLTSRPQDSYQMLSTASGIQTSGAGSNRPTLKGRIVQ